MRKAIETLKTVSYTHLDVYKRQGQGAALVRSAGNFAQLTSREGKYCVIKLPSGEVDLLPLSPLLYL